MQQGGRLKILPNGFRYSPLTEVGNIITSLNERSWVYEFKFRWQKC